MVKLLTFHNFSLSTKAISGKFQGIMVGHSPVSLAHHVNQIIP